MHERRKILTAVLAVVFLAITTATWAGVTGPGTTGAEEPATETGPILVNMPEQTTTTPESTTEVPEPPPFEDVARDLGERKADDGAQDENGKGKSKPRAEKQQGAGNGDWKAAKKAAKAECKRRYTGRARGQCISAAARAHKNPKARGHR